MNFCKAPVANGSAIDVGHPGEGISTDRLPFSVLRFPFTKTPAS